MTEARAGAAEALDRPLRLQPCAPMTDIAVSIKLLSHFEGLELPAYETAGSAGMDVRAAVAEGEPIVLAPGARAMVATGISVAIPAGYEIQVRPRSGLAAKHGLTCLNTPGTIDSDYRGEIKVILINLGQEAFTIARGHDGPPVGSRGPILHPPGCRWCRSCGT